LVDKVEIGEATYILLTTRGVELDLSVLPALLESPAAYIGVIGSRRRWQVTANKMLSAGVPRHLIERVNSPIGLELNAETPREIALSMLAEIVMLRRGGSGDQMAHKPVLRQQGVQDEEA
jgi:xanthine dehydrogenase accessory factor